MAGLNFDNSVAEAGWARVLNNARQSAGQGRHLQYLVECKVKMLRLERVKNPKNEEGHWMISLFN